MKNCPHCNGELRDSVIRCVHCGLDLKAPIRSAPPQTASPEPAASGTPGMLAPGIAAPQIPASAQFTPAVAPTPAGMPPAVVPGAPTTPVAIPTPPPAPVGDQPQYFVMKTDPLSSGGLPSGYGARAPSRGDPAKSAFIAGLLGLLGAATAGIGLFMMPLVTATASGTVDLGTSSGGPQPVNFTQGFKFGDWGGFVKTLLMIAVIGAVVFAIMVITSPDIKAVSRLLGQGVVMTAASAWLFTALPGLKDDLMSAYNMVLEIASSQVPASQQEQFRTQADSLVTIKTGVGAWMIVFGSLVVLGASIMGGMAMKRAQPSSKF